VIRINLLPTKKARAGAGDEGKLWIVFFLVALAVEGGAVAIVHLQRTSALEVIQRRNADAQRRIDLIEKEVADHDAIKQELEEIRSREDVIAKLSSARTGPVNVMMELSKILSKNGMPTIDAARYAQLCRDNPLQCVNPRWDFRNLWLTEFREEDRLVTLKGVARGHDDIAEFLKRMSLSEFFIAEQLRKTETVEDRTARIPVVAFEIRSTVRYR
jgi:Tfp pilus assembly protein PilN